RRNDLVPASASKSTLRGPIGCRVSQRISREVPGAATVHHVVAAVMLHNRGCLVGITQAAIVGIAVLVLPRFAAARDIGWFSFYGVPGGQAVRNDAGSRQARLVQVAIEKIFRPAIRIFE